MSTEPAPKPARAETETETERDTEPRLAVPSCPACGTIIPEDTTTGWTGECPSCHRINNPEEVFH